MKRRSPSKFYEDEDLTGHHLTLRADLVRLAQEADQELRFSASKFPDTDASLRALASKSASDLAEIRADRLRQLSHRLMHILTSLNSFLTPSQSSIRNIQRPPNLRVSVLAHHYHPGWSLFQLLP